MPPTEIVLFREIDGSIPLRDWLDSLPVKARSKCLAKLARLEELGHELRRPDADTLASTGLHELRIKFFRVNYRILYFFHGQEVAIVTHGLSKEDVIPSGEIQVARTRMQAFNNNPDLHSFRG